ncbi:hypothetical protein [Hanstruepera marina]|uniref:hypothetical protein n=1 Tax=Hanstruepera marina TaxID=2873265 RepID=UPI001CA73152|nr:hypothetical protein [Hanstruepera marina]
MTLYEFNLLSDHDKYQATWDLGTHIDSLVTKEHIIKTIKIKKNPAQNCPATLSE